MRKPAKRRSLGRRIVDALFATVSAMAIVAGDFIARNPVATGGAIAFLITLGFVSANALWYQPEAHQGVFFKTRPELVYKPSPRAQTLIGERAAAAPAPAAPAVEQNQAAAPAPTPTPVATEMPAPAITLGPGGDPEVARLQQKLAALGFYEGPVDGMPGPQTRKALETWRDVQARAGIAPAPSPVEGQAESPVVIPGTRPKRAEQEIDRTTTTATATQRPPAELKPQPQPAMPVSFSASSEDIIKVQAGLKAFGNDLITVDGVPGKSTQDAIREFQKLFRLKVTGQVDAELIAKMREIGLIS
ncbi:peptidoglycan-binding protein [Brucella endophytica]|uniref:Peptidoglycan-binding protein n=1 Tax=Brucella endophytica TaxID=1963359 RepID=A0A916SMX8_9HYPH|nr:peptidoglycan-binding protein [Brucella endophytica]GGB08838.1 peptidoglycan-binding protein [Brucella endophytica]